MKKVWIVACVLLFVAIAGFAETPSTPPLTQEALAAILGQPAASCAPQQQQNEVLFAAKRPKGWEKSLCNATANCFPGTVTCGGNNSMTSCSAADRNCPGEQGHVTCDGNTTWCPTACPAQCTGTPMQVACCNCDLTGGCVVCCKCDGGGAHCIFECS